MFVGKGLPADSTTQLSNSCPESFETDNGAALSAVSRITERDP